MVQYSIMYYKEASSDQLECVPSCGCPDTVAMA